MQLSKNNKGRVGATLCLITANLFTATGLQAQDIVDGTNNPSAPDSAESLNVYDQPASTPGTTTIDSAVLFYKEDGGRIQAIEPMVSLTHNTENDSVFSAKLTFDSLTGATPNGAAPWKSSQTFISPTKQANGDDENEGRTGASGGTIVIDPITGQRTLEYTADAFMLPLDSGFVDQRTALDLGFTTPLTSGTKLSLGLNGSHERDYNSFSGRASIAQDFNNKTTTLSLGVNYEHDVSKPFFGTPTPFSVMSGDQKGPSRNKNVLSLIAGVTQVMTRNWLLQFNYSYGSVTGYQTDPYKILSVVDPTTGAPQSYLYESRPAKRTRHAFYAGSKLALGSYVTDLSARYYHDSWGINSITANMSEHIPIGDLMYIEPGVRYYHQSGADFFTYYLPSNVALPLYASADSRLDSFNAITLSLSGGYMINDQIELYAIVDAYRQSKAGQKDTLPGNNQDLKLYAGTNALSMMTGVKVKF
ncbi:MAG: DUF3570 domain-containing protein [Emcibacter sp.]|nr:DUF3570 domain-containing protein [Emcibacter sp.]